MAENTKEFTLQVINLNKFYDRTQVLHDITLSFYAGAKIGMIGANGSGKTTLLRILAGADDEFDGQRIQMNGKSIGYVSQEPVLEAKKTVKEVLDDSVAHIHAITDRYNEICVLMGEATGDALERLSNEFDRLQIEIEMHNMWEVDRLLEISATALDLPPMDRECGVLSGGEARRVALCKTLIESPDILLLDEPTSGLDEMNTKVIKDLLASSLPKGCICIVSSHDSRLEEIADEIVDFNIRLPVEGPLQQMA